MKEDNDIIRFLQPLSPNVEAELDKVLDEEAIFFGF